MEKLLIALGYKKKMLIEKTRRLYKLGGCEVALDYLKLLGEYVEIEGPGEKEIHEVQKCLSYRIWVENEENLTDKEMEMLIHMFGFKKGDKKCGNM